MSHDLLQHSLSSKQMSPVFVHALELPESFVLVVPPSFPDEDEDAPCRHCVKSWNCISQPVTCGCMPSGHVTCAFLEQFEYASAFALHASGIIGCCDVPPSSVAQ